MSLKRLTGWRRLFEYNVENSPTSSRIAGRGVKGMRRLLDKKIVAWITLAVLVCLWAFFPQNAVADAPGDVVSCDAPIDLSNSEGFSSIDPFLISDPAGVAHLFWAERVFGSPGGGGTDAVMYSKWDGNTWSTPNDIFLSPPEYFNRSITGIRGVLDEQGVIHLAWMGPDNTFFYSSTRADMAGAASAWQKPVMLATDQTGTQYSFDIAYDSPQTLHIVYGETRANDAPSVTYIRSTDGGLTWSSPEDIYIFTGLDRGASNIQVVVDAPDKIYATWTEWDLSGNGQVIYFARSLDDGLTWDYPVVLDKRRNDEYERDWTNLTVLGKNQLAVIWEGGFRAYPQAQYSDDGGVTWGKPIDTFPWLIADNGFANLLWDDTGRLHAFLVRRLREDSGDVCKFAGCAAAEARGSTNTLWHSIWEGGTRWRDPKPVGNFGDGKLGDIGGAFSAVAFVGGNEFVAAWFSYLTQEIVVMNCTVEGVSPDEPKPWPTATPKPTATPLPTPTPMPVDVTLALITRPVYSDTATSQPADTLQNPGLPILFGGLISLLVVAGVVFVKQYRRY